MRYAIVIEKAGENDFPYVPDLLGCIASGATLDEVRQAIDEAICLQIEGQRADGEPVPAPTTVAESLRSRSEDPFVTFTEWADEVAYANL